MTDDMTHYADTAYSVDWLPPQPPGPDQSKKLKKEMTIARAPWGSYVGVDDTSYFKSSNAYWVELLRYHGESPFHEKSYEYSEKKIRATSFRKKNQGF